MAQFKPENVAAEGSSGGECQGERTVNHIGDDDFTLIDITNDNLLASAVFALRALWLSQPWRVSSMTVGVNRIQAVISRLFTVALDRSLVDAHPAARMIKRFQERPSDRVLTDIELRALWKTV